MCLVAQFIITDHVQAADMSDDESDDSQPGQLECAAADTSSASGAAGSLEVPQADMALNDTGDATAAGVEAIKEGAKIGNLDEERRITFSLGDVFDLKSPFLLNFLEDPNEQPSASSKNKAASGSAVVANKNSSGLRDGPLPSQATWDTW